MRKALLLVLFSISFGSLIGQTKNIEFIKEKDIYVVKLSCEFTSENQKTLFNDLVLRHKNITSVKFSPVENSFVKIICHTDKVTDHILAALGRASISTYKNLEK